MRNLFIKRFLVVLAIFSTSLINGQDLVILHSNDVHSNIETLSSGRNKGFGGLQRRANYVAKIKKENKNVLILDAGDYNQGTPYFTMFKGNVEVKLNNALGLDVATLGNHEFDNGQVELARRLSMAKYKTVCANYDFKGTPLERYVKQYTVVKKGGWKIGIVGALANLNGLVSAAGRANLTYKNPISIVDSIGKILKEQYKCDIVICLSHLGYDGGTPAEPADLDVAAQTSYIDLIIGGHTHTFLEKPTVVKNRDGRDVIVTTAGAHGVYNGRVDITFPR